MGNYWKSKVLPKIKKVFENPKKGTAAEACKAFDEAKEQYSKEFEDRKSELQPKVIQVYEDCSTEVKTLVKEPKDSGLKKHAAAVQKFLDELAKIDFPGTKAVCEWASKVGPGYMSGPVFFVFEKVTTLIVTTEEKEEEANVVPDEETAAVREKVIDVVEQDKKEKQTIECTEKAADDGPPVAVVAAEVPKP